MKALLQITAALMVAFFNTSALAQAPSLAKESGVLRAEGTDSVVLVRADNSQVSLGCIPVGILRENLGRFVDLEGLSSPTSTPGVGSHLCVRKMAVPPKGRSTTEARP